MAEKAKINCFRIEQINARPDKQTDFFFLLLKIQLIFAFSVSSLEFIFLCCFVFDVASYRNRRRTVLAVVLPRVVKWTAKSEAIGLCRRCFHESEMQKRKVNLSRLSRRYSNTKQHSKLPKLFSLKVASAVLLWKIVKKKFSSWLTCDEQRREIWVGRKIPCFVTVSFW